MPADQIEQAVLKWLDADEGGLADLEQKLRLEREGVREQSELSPLERAAACRAWAESHRPGLPLLSDEALGRESIYHDERLGDLAGTKYLKHQLFPNLPSAAQERG